MATEFTAEELREYNGSDSSKPIYVAIKGRVFDVSSYRSFYGPGCSYAMFAGRDCSRAATKISKSEDNICASLDGLTEKQIDVLEDWEKKFEAK